MGWKIFQNYFKHFYENLLHNLWFSKQIQWLIFMRESILASSCHAFLLTGCSDLVQVELHDGCGAIQWCHMDVEGSKACRIACLNDCRHKIWMDWMWDNTTFSYLIGSQCDIKGIERSYWLDWSGRWQVVSVAN